MTTTFIGKPNDWYVDILLAILDWREPGKGDEAMSALSIRNMNYAMAEREWIFEGQMAEAKLREQNRDYFLLLRDALMWLDPQGWSEWYDAYVPDWSGWLYAGPAIETLERRAEELMQ